MEVMDPGSGGSKGCCPWGQGSGISPHAALVQAGLNSWGLLEVAGLVRSLVGREEEDQKVQIPGLS